VNAMNRKLIVIDRHDVEKYDVDSLKRNLQGDIYVWQREDDDRTYLKLVRKYNNFVIIGDKYLYESFEILKELYPYFQIRLEFNSGEFFKKYSLRNNLGKYLYQALSKRAGK
jgi:hypothetical protein